MYEKPSFIAAMYHAVRKRFRLIFKKGSKSVAAVQ
jgi:hypothetical protein